MHSFAYSVLRVFFAQCTHWQYDDVYHELHFNCIKSILCLHFGVIFSKCVCVCVCINQILPLYQYKVHIWGHTHTHTHTHDDHWWWCWQWRRLLLVIMGFGCFSCVLRHSICLSDFRTMYFRSHFHRLAMNRLVVLEMNDRRHTLTNTIRWINWISTQCVVCSDAFPLYALGIRFCWSLMVYLISILYLLFA